MSNSLAQLLKNNHDFKKLNPSLDNIKKALELFGNPHADYESIIVAGTNGKGSVCTFLEQLYLKYTDLKIAKFTSPHLRSVTERIKVQGMEIAEDRLAEILLEINDKIDFELTYFEKLSLASFIYFSREKVDLAIIEVGMGGRWDCANVVPDDKRKATVITSIGLDHMQFLGTTLQEIRKEKEAIKRTDKGVPHFDYEDYNFGTCTEQRNLSLALEVFRACADYSGLVDEDLIVSAYKASYRARFEYNKEYNLLLDSAHNPDAAKVLNQYIKENFSGVEIELHLAFLDRDYKSFSLALLDELNVKDIYIYQLKDDRAAAAEAVVSELRKELPSLNIKLSKLNSIEKTEKLKVFTGSIYFCGEVLKLAS